MSEESKNKKKYGAAEIERYYNGKLTPQEMHELEKAALEDSFLADAMEGYIHASTPLTDVTSLKSRLIERQQKKGQVISMNKRKNINLLFKVAAMFLLTIGTAWMVYEFALNRSGSDISYNQETNIPESVKKSDPDTVKEQLTIDQVPSTSIVEENNPERKTSGNVKTSQGKSLQKKKIIEEKVATKKALNAPAQFDVNDEATALSTPATLKEEASSSKQQPAHDSSFTAKRSFRGKVEKLDNNHIEIRNNGNQVIITIKEAQDGVKELVLKKPKTGIIIKKKPSIIIEEAEPEESWNNFGEYISENLPDDFQSDSLKGTIKLSFEVNSAGKPVNIHVEKSLCERCDAEALKLLEKGPKWKKKTKRGKVSFLF